MKLHNKLRVGRFTQHHVDQLDMQLTPIDMLRQVAGEAVPLSVLRAHLDGMGLSGGLALQPIYTMSGTSWHKDTKCRTVSLCQR